jgi:hypothetical protein
MNPAEIRKRADHLAPLQLQAVYWTPWQALAWAVHRDEDRVLECSWIWLEKGPPCPVEGAPLRPFRPVWEEMHNNPGPKESWAEAEMRPNPVGEGWAKLWRALESGRVASSGFDAANVRREIPALAWVDLEFHVTPAVDEQGLRQPEADRPQCYREGAGPRERAVPAFKEVLVLVADVLKEFPAKGRDSASAPKGGRPPAADWSAIEEALNKEIDLVGLPCKHGSPDWRTLADVIRWVEKLTGTDEPGKSALKDNVAKMLRKRGWPKT